MKELRKCEHCGSSYNPSQKWQKFCSNSCRVTYCVKKKREESNRPATLYTHEHLRSSGGAEKQAFPIIQKEIQELYRHLAEQQNRNTLHLVNMIYEVKETQRDMMSALSNFIEILKKTEDKNEIKLVSSLVSIFQRKAEREIKGIELPHENLPIREPIREPITLNDLVPTQKLPKKDPTML